MIRESDCPPVHIPEYATGGEMFVRSARLPFKCLQIWRRLFPGVSFNFTVRGDVRQLLISPLMATHVAILWWMGNNKCYTNYVYIHIYIYIYIYRSRISDQHDTSLNETQYQKTQAKSQRLSFWNCSRNFSSGTAAAEWRSRWLALNGMNYKWCRRRRVGVCGVDRYGIALHLL